MSIRLRLTLLPGLVLAALALGALPSTSEAQFGKRLKDAVKRTAEDKAIQKATPEESRAIDGARLEAKGLGQTKPVGSNDSAEGWQQNRWVELVKR